MLKRAHSKVSLRESLAGRVHPLTRERFRRFRQSRRGFYSFLVMSTLILSSLLAELFVNSKALAVYYDGRLHFPTYSKIYTGEYFGLDYQYEVDYRELKELFKSDGTGSWVIMPFVPYNPYEQEFREDGTFPPYPPSLSHRHFLGTDKIGRDIVARIVYGFRTAIFFALAVTFSTFFVGTVVGTLMGYKGGLFDTLFQRFIEVIERIPFLYVVMILVSIYRPQIALFTLIFILFGWSGRTWSVRAMAYRERECQYIAAAKSMGASTWRIITVHIIPNVLVVVVTMLPFAIAGAIASLTALDYLGFGLAPPTPSWGELLAQGYNNLSSPWILASITTAMVLTLVMIAFIGEALREAFDPKRFTKYI